MYIDNSLNIFSETMADYHTWIQGVGVVLMFMCLSMTEGLTCLECTGIANPDLCNQVIHCGPHEICYSQLLVTTSGAITWNLGCRDTLQCSSSGKREEPKPRDISSRAGDLVVCDECCNGDLCNRQQCKHTSPSDHGPICYECSSVSSPADCDQIQVCGRSERCSMMAVHDGISSRTSYNLGCRIESICHALSSLTGSGPNYCNFCCDSDLCNGVCSDIKTTTPAIVTPPPTAPPRTNGLTCFSCRDVPSAASCQEVVRCGNHESCYMDEVVRSDGSLSYRFGCRNVDACSGTIPQVGRRAGGDLGTCSQCCQTDLCQKNLCGKNDLRPRADRGPVCFKCITSEANRTCSDVIECSRDQACYQSFGSGGTYTHGCFAASVCSTVGTMSANSCFKCCLNDVCNVGCH